MNFGFDLPSDFEEVDLSKWWMMDNGRMEGTAPEHGIYFKLTF